MNYSMNEAGEDLSDLASLATEALELTLKSGLLQADVALLLDCSPQLRFASLQPLSAAEAPTLLHGLNG
jgi:hypothetical protein